MKFTNQINPHKIFIDSSAWVELCLKKEKYHQQVADYFISSDKKGGKFFTSDYVLDETYTRLMTRQGIKECKYLKSIVQEAVASNHLLILWTDVVIFEKAWKLFMKYSEHRLSFTDCTIAVLIQDLKLDEILTLDQGFAKIGLLVAPAINI